MTIRVFGGGGGGAAGSPFPGYHSDAVQFHYRLDDNTDSGTAPGGYGNLSGTMKKAPFTGVDDSHDPNEVTFSVAATDMKVGTAVTVAAWVYMTANPSSNVAICGVRSPGGGSDPNTHNFPWELGVTTLGYARFFWQSGNKVNQGCGDDLASAIALDQWVHVMGTRNAAGTECQLWVDGVQVASSTGLTVWDGGGDVNTCRIGGNSTAVFLGYIASVVGDNEHTTDGLAFYEAARRTSI